jgi:hypothetical protein
MFIMAKISALSNSAGGVESMEFVFKVSAQTSGYCK